MVTSVARMPTPRIGVDGARPLNVRMAEILDVANRELPHTGDWREGIFNLQFSEASIDLVQARITAARNARDIAEAPHPMVIQHCNEMYHLINREGDGYNPLARKINDAQPQLLSLRRDRRYRKLGDRVMPADCIVTLPLLDSEKFRPKSVQESKAILDNVLVRHREALRVWSLISTALAFQNQPPEQQAMALALAIVDDEHEMRRDIIALQSEVQALRSIVTKPKRKRK
jgi:hypothetical protein